MARQMGQNGRMLSPRAVHDFISGQTLHAFDPETGARAASVTYRADGRVEAQFADGASDIGTWGLSGAQYWTRYTTFRDGEIHHFSLERIDADTAQAYHADGRRAFVQSRNPEYGRPA